MKIRNPFDDSDSSLEFTSLIDVMFLLLIFFLLTTSFEHEKKQNIINVELPIAEHVEPEVKRSPLLIGIDKSGEFIIEQHHFDKRHIFEELKARINTSSDSMVVIYADQSAPYHAVVFVYDMLQALGVKHFSHQVQ